MGSSAWIPITIWAAFAQTVRNAAQRHLTAELGTLGATLVRFLFGLPFAVLWLAAVTLVGGFSIPSLTLATLLWTILGALAQIAATAFLLRAMEERNFALGVAWSKTEILQVALFGLILLGDRLTPIGVAAIVVATLGVLLLSSSGAGFAWGPLLRGWTSRPALLGLASGAAFALSAIGYRGAALALAPAPAPIAAATVLVAAQALQVAALGGWLLVRDAMVVRRVLRAWRASLLAGLMGAAASAGWFTAMAMAPVAPVRTVGLIELFFSFIVSQRIFRERLSRREIAGLALVGLGLLGVINAR
jgi:drug/metabolite transporter (DMT)-like permease